MLQRSNAGLWRRSLVGLFAMSVSMAAVGGPAGASNDEPVAKAKPKVDLVFCVDTTGSMSGELEAVKVKTKEIVAKLAGAKPTPEIRVGVVAFRDKGDEYVTKVFPFTEDIDKIVSDIQSLKAIGGGDEPEAVTEALHATVTELNWSTDKKATKVVFLIGDAQPKHSNLDWHTECKNAIAQGIQINTIACNGLDITGSDVFKQIAKLTDGQAQDLTYRQEIVNADGKTETVVVSAGKTFAVDGAGDAWREGAGALAARGKAMEVARAPLAPSSMRSMGRSLTASKSAHFYGAPRHMEIIDERPVLSLRGIAAGASAAPSAAPSAGAVSRGDSNLADIVVQSTMARMKKVHE